MERTRAPASDLRQFLLHQPGQLGTHKGDQFPFAGPPDPGHTAEAAQKSLLPFLTDTRDIVQDGMKIPQRTAFAVIGHGKAVGLISNLLQQANGSGTFLQPQHIFLTHDVNQFFFFRNAGQRQIFNTQLSECLVGKM